MIARNSRLSFLALPLLVIFLLSLPARSGVRAQGAQPVTVRVAPALLQLNAGQTGEMTVEVVDVQGLYGFDIQVAFNPSVVEVVDADPARAGVQVAAGNFLEAGFVAVNEVDNTTGTLRFVTTQLNPSPPKSGSGVLIRFQLHALLGGSSTPVTPTYVQLADRDGEEIPMVPIPGRAEVAGTPGAQPTNTQGPTQTGTTPAPTAQASPTQTATGQPGYPGPESPTPFPAETQPGGYPAPTAATPGSPTPRPTVTVVEPLETETPVTETATVTASPTPQPAAPAENPGQTALLETAIILMVILVLALGAVFIFLQLTRSA